MNIKTNFVGKLFQVPLENGSVVTGLVTEQNEELLLGYFFHLSQIIDAEQLTISPEQAIYVAIHGPRGFLTGEWKIIGDYPSFDTACWPIPSMKVEDPIRKRWFRVDYERDLISQTRTRISDEEAENLFPSGVAGHKFLSKRLHRILSEK